MKRSRPVYENEDGVFQASAQNVNPRILSPSTSTHQQKRLKRSGDYNQTREFQGQMGLGQASYTNNPLEEKLDWSDPIIADFVARMDERIRNGLEEAYLKSTSPLHFPAESDPFLDELMKPYSNEVGSRSPRMGTKADDDGNQYKKPNVTNVSPSTFPIKYNAVPELVVSGLRQRKGSLEVMNVQKHKRGSSFAMQDAFPEKQIQPHQDFSLSLMRRDFNQFGHNNPQKRKAGLEEGNDQAERSEIFSSQQPFGGFKKQKHSHTINEKLVSTVNKQHVFANRDPQKQRAMSRVGDHETIIIDPVPQQEYKCQVCRRTLLTYHDLVGHMNTHRRIDDGDNGDLSSTSPATRPVVDIPIKETTVAASATQATAHPAQLADIRVTQPTAKQVWRTMPSDDDLNEVNPPSVEISASPIQHLRSVSKMLTHLEDTAHKQPVIGNKGHRVQNAGSQHKDHDVITIDAPPISRPRKTSKLPTQLGSIVNKPLTRVIGNHQGQRKGSHRRNNDARVINQFCTSGPTSIFGVPDGSQPQPNNAANSASQDVRRIEPWEDLSLIVEWNKNHDWNGNRIIPCIN